jgi:hypothetical protein
MSPAPFAWHDAIGFGLGVLRLSPESFWRMTPRLADYVRGILKADWDLDVQVGFRCEPAGNPA